MSGDDRTYWRDEQAVPHIRTPGPYPVSGDDRTGELDLDAIEARADAPRDGRWASDALRMMSEDVPRLVAEVRRLRALVGELTDERDRYLVSLNAELDRQEGFGRP